MEIKDKILITATEQFFKYGIRSVTMDDLANEIGISKKTLYQYFEDKDALVHEVANRHFNMECEHCNRLYAVSANPIDELVHTTIIMREMFSKTNPALLLDIRKYHPKTWDLYKENKEFFRSMIHRNLLEGMEQGYYRKDIHPDILANIRLESIEMAFEMQVVSQRKYELVEIQMELFSHFVHGIVTSKGLQLFNELSVNQSINL